MTTSSAFFPIGQPTRAHESLRVSIEITAVTRARIIRPPANLINLILVYILKSI